MRGQRRGIPICYSNIFLDELRPRGGGGVKALIDPANKPLSHCSRHLYVTVTAHRFANRFAPQ